MHRLLIGITLALLVTILATPALAQQKQMDGVEGEQFQSSETQEANSIVSEHMSEYNSIEAELEELDAIDYFDQTDAQQQRVDQLEERQSELESEYETKVEDLVSARRQTIEDAPVEGSPQGRLDALRDKQDASRRLQSYAEGELSYTSDLYPSSIDDNYPEYEDEIEATQEEVAATEEERQQDSGAASPSGSEGGSGGGNGSNDSSGDSPSSSTSSGSSGIMASLGSVVSGIIGFFVSVVVLTAAVLGIMAFVAYRRTGSATAASTTILSKPRILLAGAIAFVISLMGGLGAIWTLLQGLLILLAIPLAILIAVMWWWGGSLSAGLRIIASWLPFLRGTRGEGPDTDDGSQPPGGGTPPGGGPIIGGDSQAHNGAEVQDSRPALQKYVSRDLTQLARDGALDEAVGRQDEIDSVVEILNRRKANNAAITGLAGVGKTVLVEELARKLAAGRVPPQLAGKEVLELDLTAINSGATLVGMFEERLQAVIDEVKAEPDRYILFVDEMHTLMTTGASANNPTGSADILKPALARGELRMIGATTLDEYREIEKDPAMARRFGRVDMPPLSVDQTIQLLPTTAVLNEEHYDLSIEQDALTAAARLADRHITDQELPGAATNLLETVCSSVALRGGDTVTADDVARIVSRQTGVPVGGASDDERQQVLNLEESLRERMVGQDEAVTAVADAIKRKRSGFGAGRPASFGFFGVTGVGKTELAKALAEVLFGDENAMVRLDMSEYSTSTAAGGGSKWKLLGSDKGFSGSDEGGELTEPVRRRPYSVVLLDEIEKANREVLDPLLSILDDGHVTDGRGRKIDFSNTIVIMTSNHAADVVADRWNRGLELTEEELAEALVQRQMRPELVQRLTKIAVFNPLKPDEVREIARIMLSKTAMTTAEEHGINVSFDDPVVAAIAQKGYAPQNGLRPLRRVIERQIEGPIADYTLKNGENKADITFVIKEGEIRARKTRENEQ